MEPTMPIALQLATDDTPEPWQAAAVAEAGPLEYAREGLPSAPRKSIWRTMWAMVKRLFRALGWTVGAALVAVAFTLLIASTVIRMIFAAGAGTLLMLRRLGPSRLYERLRYGRVPTAQLA